MTRRIARLLPLLGAALLAGCATSFRGSYLVGERYFKTNIDTFPVIILSVDGRDYLQRRILVDAGPCQIAVQAPPVPGAPSETATFILDVRPCFTYSIVAVRENPILAAVTPRVGFAEPLAGRTLPPAKQAPLGGAPLRPGKAVKGAAA